MAASCPAHQLSDTTHIGRIGRHIADDPAAVDDEDAVTEGEEFIEVGRDHENGTSLVTHGNEGAMDRLDGADVDAL